MGLFYSITGETFGRWEVISYAGKSKWLCRCSCGTFREVSKNSLVSGASTSCGCHIAEMRKGSAPPNKSHGLTNSPTWKIWRDMRTRCNNPNATSYSKYGGRGIRVCSRWDSFESFLKDMGERPPSTSLDRIDVNGDYEPSNCRWATAKQQARNKRETTLLTFRGETKAINDWADELGIHYRTIRSRLNSGWSIEDALSKPINEAKRNSRCAAPHKSVTTDLS